MFCRSLFVILSFFGHYLFCPSSYRFWLPLWYLQTLLIIVKVSCHVLCLVAKILPFLYVCALQITATSNMECRTSDTLFEKLKNYNLRVCWTTDVTQWKLFSICILRDQRSDTPLYINVKCIFHQVNIVIKRKKTPHRLNYSEIQSNNRRNKDQNGTTNTHIYFLLKFTVPK